ncbi:unnamed protein product [Vitrella brassicaformis CCMP3155]|uniref:EamA domain-containing protein n=1 Tax=Vitrella brassicaformis (strain CCMP3155) TaxID=1169540 RepID=A0A0G4EQE9_VITBC|nr:unnamed protein product [Vitrella brassicaformis CCMP3155]|eukprot:CEL99691.1 unnamed protein product [Vitrella brassicaformis CCMP3155]
MGPLRVISPQRFGLSVALAFLAVLLFCLNGELLQWLQSRGAQRVSPMLNIWLCHVGGVLFVPFYLSLFRGSNSDEQQNDDGREMDEEMTGVWFHTRQDDGRCTRRAGRGGVGMRSVLISQELTGRRLVVLSVVLSFALIAYNYCWSLSAYFVPVNVTNAAFQTSVAFVYCASVVFLRSALTTPKVLAVIGALAGAYLASSPNGSVLWVEGHEGQGAKGVTLGVFIGLTSAFLNAVYQVGFKKTFRNPDMHFMGLYGILVALAHIVFILPVVALFHFAGWERIEFPTEPSMVVGVVVSAAVAFGVNCLSVVVIALHSPLLLTCAFALAIPISLLLDLSLHSSLTHISPTAIIGDLMIVVAFLILSGVTDHPAVSLSSIRDICVVSVSRIVRMATRRGKGPHVDDDDGENAETAARKRGSSFAYMPLPLDTVVDLSVDSQDNTPSAPTVSPAASSSSGGSSSSTLGLGFEPRSAASRQQGGDTGLGGRGRQAQ